MKRFDTGSGTGVLRQVATGLALMMALGMCAQSSTGPSSIQPTEKGAGAEALTTSQTEHFIKEAARGSTAEVASAQVAEKTAQNQQVKQLAQTIRRDHEQALQKLKPMAETHGISLQQQLNPEQQRTLQQLQQAQGAQFDREYVTSMLRDHEKDIQKFERAAQQVQEADVAAYARNTLPVLRKHFEQAQNAGRAIGMSQQEISAILKQTPGGMGGSGQDSENQTGKSSEQ